MNSLQEALLAAGLLPLTCTDHAAEVGILHTEHVALLQTISLKWGVSLKPRWFSAAEFHTERQQALQAHCYSAFQTEPHSAPPLSYFSEVVLQHAVLHNASDIHIEPTAENVMVRFRQDGLLQVITTLHTAHAPLIANHFKILSHLDIAEKRLPLDGQFTYRFSDETTHTFRLSTCPSVYGESLVMRRLPQSHTHSWDTLGLLPADQQIFREALDEPHGLILVTGPTCSGKTATLYTAIQHLATHERKVLTIEDPVEMIVPNVIQVNSQPKIGLDFSHAIRAFLRHDPDVILIGEIRDTETATAAIRAAHTGHLVLATLHTPNTLEALTRLVHLGIPRFELTSTITLIVAQRLIRKRCETGYRGRTGIFELLRMSPALKTAFLAGQAMPTLTELAKETGWIALVERGQQAVSAGITDTAEWRRVCGSL